jgi:hypothetical protein
MHASDDTPLSEFLIDSAVVRGTLGGKNDERFVRGRIAVFVSILGMAGLMYAAMVAQVWAVAVVGIPLLLAGAWLFAERPGFLFRR